MRFDYRDKPTKVDVKHYLGAANEGPHDDAHVHKSAAVFEIGAYQITVQGHSPVNPAEVTYVRAHGEHREAVDRVFPNMDVSDGVMRIPVEDIVELMLARLEPVDLAKALWTDKDVRDEFIHYMTNTYSSDDITDADRRQFLREVKEAVHTTEVAALASRFADSEYNLAKSIYYWDQVQNVNRYLAQAEQRVRRALGQPLEPTPEQTEVFTIPRFRDEGQDPVTKIGGTVWHECRDWWRAKMAELFPS